MKVAKAMIKQDKGLLYIGTSGIVLPGSKQSFPAEFQSGSRLSYYASLFNTLEVNSTFRKIPMLSTLEKWALDVPHKFQFTLKMWQEITHAKHLNFDPVNIDTFFNAANHLSKNGCMLIQFPGSITAEHNSKVEQILKRLKKLDKENKWRIAAEFRSNTFYNITTYQMLNKYGCSIVLHDMPKSKNDVVNDAAKFVYCRYHGEKGDYRGSYTKHFLHDQAKNMQNWLAAGKDVYAYFNNTMGNAFENAMSLKEMMEKR